MEFIVASSLKNITALDARQLASIVWCCAQLAHDQPLMPLLDALDGFLDELPTQQVGWLADSQSLPVGLHARVTQRLGFSVNLLKESLAQMVPGPDGFSETSKVLQGFAEAVARVGADQLGNSGSRSLLTACGISEISPNALSPELCKLDHGKDSKRLLVTASFAFDIKIHGAPMSQVDSLQGSYVAVSGTKDGIRGNRWISPVQLPVASLVDRSLCGEFQVLAKLCDEILEKTGQELPMKAVEGTVHLFVTATPCLSCIAVICQFHRLFPEIQVEVSWDGSIENGKCKKKWKQNHRK